MDSMRLSREIRRLGDALQDPEAAPMPPEVMREVGECLCVLSRVVADPSRSMASVFGAPGDWSSATGIPDALRARSI